LERPTPISSKFVAKKFDFFLSVFRNREKPLLPKTTTRLALNEPLLILYPRLFRSHIFLDIWLCHGNMKIEKIFLITPDFQEEIMKRDPLKMPM
jgi:hypothetical protein